MYFQKKRCVAMLLAGGQGSRLKVNLPSPSAVSTASSIFPCLTVSTPTSTPSAF